MWLVEQGDIACRNLWVSRLEPEPEFARNINRPKWVEHGVRDVDTGGVRKILKSKGDIRI